MTDNSNGKIVITFGKYMLHEAQGTEREKHGKSRKSHNHMDILAAPKSWQRKLWEKTRSWDMLPGPDWDGFAGAASWRLSNTVRIVINFRYDIRLDKSTKIVKRLVGPTVVVCDRLEDLEQTLGNFNRIMKNGAGEHQSSSSVARPVFKVIMVFRDYSYSTYMGSPDKFMDQLWINHTYPNHVVIKRRGQYD